MNSCPHSFNEKPLFNSAVFSILAVFFVSHKFRHFQLFCDLKLLEELTLLNADGNATVA